jgi:hypothetical protein
MYCTAAQVLHCKHYIVYGEVGMCGYFTASWEGSSKAVRSVESAFSPRGSQLCAVLCYAELTHGIYDVVLPRRQP